MTTVFFQQFFLVQIFFNYDFFQSNIFCFDKNILAIIFFPNKFFSFFDKKFFDNDFIDNNFFWFKYFLIRIFFSQMFFVLPKIFSIKLFWPSIFSKWFFFFFCQNKKDLAEKNCYWKNIFAEKKDLCKKICPFWPTHYNYDYFLNSISFFAKRFFITIFWQQFFDSNFFNSNFFDNFFDNCFYNNFFSQ